MARFAFGLSLVLLVTSFAIAQDPAAGIQPFSTQIGGPVDSVDIATSNILIKIPVRSKIGSLPFSFALLSNSHAYKGPVVAGGSWQLVSSGFSGKPIGLPAATLTSSRNKYDCHSIGQFQNYLHQDYAIVDATGASHPLDPDRVAIDEDTSNYCNPPPQGVKTIDGSGYTVNFTNYYSGDIYDKSGNKVSGFVTSDPDGNKITFNGSYTDTLGAVAVTVVIQSGSPDKYQYTDASGNTQRVQVSYSPQTLMTNFGCYREGPPIPANLPSSISMPGEGQYNIYYEATQGQGYSGDVTGRISKITLPSGGYVKYSYGGGPNNGGLACLSQVVPTLTRTVYDGTTSSPWTYVNTNTSLGPSNFTVTETDPSGNQTVHYFAGTFQTATQVYQGGCPKPIEGCNGGGTQLRGTTTCYNGNLNNGLGGCQTAVPTLPITQTDVYTWMGMAPQALTETTYDCKSVNPCYGLVTSVGRWDWGATIPPTSSHLISTTSTPIGSWNGSSCVAVGNYINDRVCYKNVSDGGGGPQSSETFAYSPQGHLLTHVVGTTTNGINGPTLISSNSYNSNGTPHIAFDVNGAQTNYNYDGSCASIVPTSVSEPLSLSRSMAWDCNGGVIKNSTDENHQLTTYDYSDPLWRMKSVTAPFNGTDTTTNFNYTDPNHSESILDFNGSVSTVDTTIQTDGLGRPIVVQKAQDQSETNFDSVQYQYGWTPTTPTVQGGPFTQQSMPNSGSPSAWTKTQNDALGRPITITDAGTGTVSYTYNQNDVLITRSSPAISKQLEYDGLGRLTSVCEITSASGSGSCGQKNPATGFLTKYTYDPLGNLLTVTQNAQPGAIGGTQTRTYHYDAVSRLTQEINPENGTTLYFYDTAPSTPGVACPGTYSGDLVKEYDAQGNTVCNTYDGLHRVLTTKYPAGLNSGSSPTRNFAYDTTSFSCANGSNVAGRLAEAFTGSSSGKITDRAYCYSPRGEVTDVYSSTPNSGGYYHVSKSYWANGVVNTLSGILGVPTITYGVDGEGRWNTVSGGSAPLVSATLYNPASQVSGVTFGSGDSDAYLYDPAGRMKQYTFTVGGQSVIGQPTWNSNGTLQKFQVTQDPFNPGNVQTCNYGFDALARVSSVGCGSVWGQTFTYDAFGNITKTGSSSWTPTYASPSNNQYLSGWHGVTYDNNGNLTNDTFHTYQWDADGHASVVNGINVIYDALGRAVERDWPDGGKSETVYDETGLTAVMQGTSMGVARIPLPGGAWARYTPSGLSDYWHPDWLGTSRLESTPGRTVDVDAAFAPFGEIYAHADNFDLTFTGNTTTDTVIDMDDFPFRRYHPTQGRWISPDPAGLSAADPTNPQSWNRYAYVLNNPLSYVDPTGLYCRWDRDQNGQVTNDATGDADTGTQGQCEALGGNWVPDNGLYTEAYLGVPNNDYTLRTQTTAPVDNSSSDGFAANTATISAGTLDQLNDYCSARGRARFIADWVPGGGTMARTLWGTNNGGQLGFYQLSTADLNNITGENSGGQTVALHAASEGLKTAAGSTAFLSWFRGATGVPKALASTWLGRLSLALIVADASSGFYKEGKEILNCQAGD